MSLLRIWGSAFRVVARASVRPPVLPLGSLMGFGVLIPMRHGADFFDTRMVLAYALLPMLFVAAPIAAGLAPASAARKSAGLLLTWVSAGSVFGLLIGSILMTASIATVNLAAGSVPWQIPDGELLSAFLACCLSAVWFVCASAAFLAVLLTPAWSKSLLRAWFFLVLLVLYAGPPLMPVDLQLWLADNYLGMAWVAAMVFSLAAFGMTRALAISLGSQTAAAPST